MELHHPSRAPSLLAHTADTTFRNRIFCCRRGSRKLQAIKYVCDITTVSRTTKCDVILKGMWLQVSAGDEWLRNKNSVVMHTMHISPAIVHAWGKCNTHIWHTQRKSLVSRSVMSASRYAIVTTIKHLEGWNELDMSDFYSTGVPKAHLSVTNWIF